VVNKVRGDEEEEENDIRLSRMGQTAPLNPTLCGMFKDERDIEMGVSFIDVEKQSTLVGKARSKTIEHMNHEQFSKNKSSFKPSRGHPTQSQLKRLSLSNQLPSSLLQEHKNLGTHSDAESKSISAGSWCSHFLERTGKISRNERVYSYVFG
jgi:hypothetical protein